MMTGIAIVVVVSIMLQVVDVVLGFDIDMVVIMIVFAAVLLVVVIAMMMVGILMVVWLLC